jgi:hypothetical protein
MTIAVDMEVGNARQQRPCVAWGELEREDAHQRVPRGSLGAKPASRWRLAVDRIEIPDFPRRAGLSATRKNLSRVGAAAERGGQAKKAGADQRARRFLQNHGAISNTIARERK